MKRAFLILLLGWLLTGVMPAQVAIGEKAPIPEADEIFNGKIKRLSDLKGRLVLYEFFAHW